jgi:3-hydroxyisobutyrate dehydrogenase-like beta-hydroxyacid dehydrogenase
MGIRIGVIGTGEMGSGVGGHLVVHGAEVYTTLAGRSAASAERVNRAGIALVDDLPALARTCPLVLSILPPDRALAVAEAFVEARGGVGGRTLYVDCNAIAPSTARAIGNTVTAAGMRYVDASIIGAAPRVGRDGPHIYACGAAADVAEFAGLNAYGLEIRPLEGVPIGAASALKMCYAGITKAYIGIGAAMFDHAERAGVGPALKREFEEHQVALNAWLGQMIPLMYPKAYRWIGEMREIGSFNEAEPGLGPLYEGLAQYYTMIAEMTATKGHA